MWMKWKTPIAKVAVWILLELILNLLGLDTLADYSEFLFHTRSISLTNSAITQSKIRRTL
jgi:hypothetical protein